MRKARTGHSGAPILPRLRSNEPRARQREAWRSGRGQSRLKRPAILPHDLFMRLSVALIRHGLASSFRRSNKQPASLPVWKTRRR